MRRLLIVAASCGLLAGLVAGSSCLIDRRTSEFSCDSPAECGDGRTCTNGFCVVVDAPPIPACVASDCEENGGTCDATDKCTFSSPATVMCPAGVPCQVDCALTGSCTSVNCGQASSCKVTCGGGTCSGTITCGAGGCDVDCNGDNTCGDVVCGTGHCEVTCAGTGSCPMELTCGQDCTFECTGANSCGVVPTCNGKCECDISCAGTGSCGAATPTCSKANCLSADGCDRGLPGCNC